MGTPLTGCRHCKEAVLRGWDTAVLHAMATKTGSSALYRCRHCGVFWDRTAPALQVLEDTEAMQKFPESFRDGSVRGPGLSALQEGLAEIRKYCGASPGPPPTQPPTTNQP